MKKIIAILLSVIMLFAMTTPAFAADTAEKTVNIYLVGYGSHLVDENGNKIWPTPSFLPALKEMLSDLLKDLAKGMLIGDYDSYCDRLYDIIAPSYADVKLDKNGESTDENGNPYFGYDNKNPATNYEYSNSKYDGGIFYFNYDWRLSVEHNAALLVEYTNNVMAREGATKANLVGRCLGGNIISALLQNADDAFLSKLDKVVLYIPSTLGVEFLTALFSGNIVLDPDAIDNFVKYSMMENDVIGGALDPALAETITTIVQFVNEAYILGIGTDVIEGIVQAVKNNALSRIVRDTYGSFPSFWSMVKAEYVDEAVNLVYNTKELKEEYAGMIDKIMSYRDNVQVNAVDRVKELKADGIDIMIISKYNYANFPLSADALLQSDGTCSTASSSFGAVTSNFGETLTNKYIGSIAEEDLKYLSADKMINASTCALPETTWFVKNLEHGDFPGGVDKLINKFLISESMTIDTYEEYPQYLDYDKETDTLSPVTELADGDVIPTGNEKRFSAFIRFFTLILNFFKKLFSGEDVLGGLLGKTN